MHRVKSLSGWACICTSRTLKPWNLHCPRWANHISMLSTKLIVNHRHYICYTVWVNWKIKTGLWCKAESKNNCPYKGLRYEAISYCQHLRHPIFSHPAVAKVVMKYIGSWGNLSHSNYVNMHCYGRWQLRSGMNIACIPASCTEHCLYFSS